MSTLSHQDHSFLVTSSFLGQEHLFSAVMAVFGISRLSDISDWRHRLIAEALLEGSLPTLQLLHQERPFVPKDMGAIAIDFRSSSRFVNHLDLT